MTDFFLHIPRSGGSSLRTLLSLNYPADSILAFSGVAEEYSRFLSLEDEARAAFQLIHGHFPLGLHAGLEHFRYFTIIRDPVSRHFSEFFYARKYEEHHDHEKIKRGELTLDQWSEIGEADAFYHSNALCQFLSGDFLINKPTHATYLAACSNLEKMQVFGLTDHFQESALMISKYMDWKRPVYGMRNVIMGNSEISEDIIRKARSCLEWDLALYEFAGQLFQKRIKAESKTLFPALEDYADRVSKASGDTVSTGMRYLAEETTDQSIVEANNFSESSPIHPYLTSPKLNKGDGVLPIPLKPVRNVMKILECAQYFNNLQIFNRTIVRVWWLGLIDVKDFPRVYHKVFGWFTCDPRDERGWARFSFDDLRIGRVATNPYIFPVMEDLETGQRKRFLYYKGHDVRYEILEGGRWVLVEHPFKALPWGKIQKPITVSPVQTSAQIR